MIVSAQTAQTAFIVSLVLILVAIIPSAAQNLAEGVTDHGVAAPVGRATWGDSTIATVDPEGNRQVFIKLWTGSDTSYLFVDAATGETEQVWPEIGGWGAYLTHYVPEHDVIYDTMGSWLVEIDAKSREVRRVGEIPGGMALSFTSDEDGVVYAGIYPSATIVSYDAATGEYTNYGQVGEEEWPQYARPIALDQHGWVYLGLGQTLGQVAGLNTATGEVVRYVPEADRARGQGSVRRGVDGEVYASAPGWGWHRLSAGEATPVEAPADAVSSQHREFPDGSRIAGVDPANRTLQIVDAGAEEPREVHFDYESTGVRIYTIEAGPDGTIYGATGVPLRIWEFDPGTGELQDRGLGGNGGHVNEFVLQGDVLYGGVYSSGSLIAYDPSQPYDDEHISRAENPRELHGWGEARDLYGRPSTLLAHPDGRHVLMGGMAARVLTGGGILIYDTETGEETVLDREDLLPDEGPWSMTALPNGDVIVGTTTKASTGGASVADEASLYRIDWETKQMAEQWRFDPPTSTVRDLIAVDGLIYGLTTDNRFFVFDPASGEFVHDEEVTAYGAGTGMQAQRTMAVGPDGGIYVLFRDAIARFEPGTCAHEEVVRPGVTISAGIAIEDGRIYFASGPRLLSYDLGLNE